MTPLLRSALVAVVLLAACSSGKPQVCIPGQSVACTGPAGCAGGQVCNTGGSAYGPCDCGTVDAGPTDAGAGTPDAAGWVDDGGACPLGASRACGVQVGECTAGRQACIADGGWGTCVDAGQPAAELCDGKDNDCNGTIDDAMPSAPLCPLTAGVCAAARQQCVAGHFDGGCSPADYGAGFEALETKCDGADNDCDGLVDATQPAVLVSNISEFVFAEYDGGFSLVGVEEPPAGGYQLVVQRLTATLQKRGGPVLISAPATPGVQNTMTLAARVNPEGTTFVAWTERDADAGIRLSSVEAAGAVRAWPAYLQAERMANTPLSLGVNATKVFVAWPAHPGTPPGTASTYNNVARLVTWDLTDGGLTTRDFLGGGDAGYDVWNDVYGARVSPTGRVMGIRGYDNDGGSSYSTTFELAGAQTSSAGLGGRFQFVEVGSVVSTGWTYLNPGFLGIFDPESGMEYRPDVFSAFTGVLKKQSDDKITTGNLGRGYASTLISWTEDYKVAVIGTPFGNGGQARTRTLSAYLNGLIGDLQLGHPGGTGQWVGVVWRNTKSGPGNIIGQLICQP